MLLPNNLKCDFQLHCGTHIQKQYAARWINSQREISMYVKLKTFAIVQYCWKSSALI